MPGRIWRKVVLISTPSAVALATSGPPQGNWLKMPIGRVISTARYESFISMRLNSVRNAAVQTTMVVVVSPSSVTMLATMMVATHTFIGSPLASLMKKMQSGSNRPALSMMPKNRMAKRISTSPDITPILTLWVVGFWLKNNPFLIQSKISSGSLPVIRQATSPKTMGTRISAVKTLSFFLVSRTRKTTIMA